MVTAAILDTAIRTFILGPVISRWKCARAAGRSSASGLQTTRGAFSTTVIELVEHDYHLAHDKARSSRTSPELQIELVWRQIVEGRLSDLVEENKEQCWAVVW